MDYKMFFRKAFSDIREYHSCPDDVTIVNDILERAEKMKKDNNYETAYGSQAYEVQTSPVKPRKALSVFAGIAGTALLLTGAVFGLNWLNEHGILREGGIESSTGAGYSSNAGTTAADANDSGFDYIFQSFSIQRPLKTFDFDGFSVNIMKYEFDGKKFNLYYNVIYDEDFELSRSDRGMCLSIDHNNGIAGHGFDNTISETDREEDHVMSWELLIQDGRCTSYDMSFIPSYSRYKEYTVDEYTKLKEENKFNMTPNAENVVSALPIAEDMQAVVTTAVCITNPPVEATTVTAVLPDFSEEDTTTTVTAGDSEAIVTSAIVLDHLAEDTTDPSGTGWEGVTSLGFNDKNVNMTAFRYDGRFLEARLVGNKEDLYHVGVRSSTRARNIIQSLGRYDEETGSAVFYALLDVPAGEYDNIEFINLSTVSTAGYPVAGSSISIKGTDDSEPLMERVGLDMTEFGIPNAVLEWLTLSPVGLEMSYTSKEKYTVSSSDIRTERTSLNGTVVPFSGLHSSTVYDEKTGTYHTSAVVVPDDYMVDLLDMKEFSINGLKTKRAEFMPKSFWDLSSEPNMNELQPVETAVQMNYPEQ